MPRTVTFRFSEQDIEAEKQEAEVKKLRAEERSVRINSGELNPILARQIAQDQGDLDLRYLELMGEDNLTPDMLVQQEEKPEGEDDPTREEGDEKVYIMPNMEIDAYVGGLKGLWQRSLAKVKRDTEESEAVQALRMAAGALADSANQPQEIIIQQMEQKAAPLPDIIVNVPAPIVSVTMPEYDEITKITGRDKEGNISETRKTKIRK